MTEDIVSSEPVRVQVVRWRCPFCNRSHSGRVRAREHIARCWLNPAARSCKTCAHFDEGWGTGDTCAKGLNVNVPVEYRPNVFKLPVNCSVWEADSEVGS